MVALALVGAAPVAAAPDWPDTFLRRIEALALIETLNADLLASDSATQTLQNWCAAHHLAGEATIHAHLERTGEKPLDPAERQRLEIGPEEPVIYRRVELTCGDHILSRADNWYVPSRLTAAMNKSLTTTDTPFGRAIKDLKPHRRTFSVAMLWHPLPEGWENAPPQDRPQAALAIPPVLFEHRAIVYAGDGKPVSEVDESYARDLLDFRLAR